jgi:predicted dehydrogenase
MNTIKWGIIGCGDVTELKSGPAFNKVPNSILVAVMRRDGGKARDYATRHGVPKWYDDAYKLINDPDINAVYVATPPDSHEEYTVASLRAGKPVYVEKPMTLNAASAERMLQTAKDTNCKLSVAHYRHEQPMFRKIKELVDKKTIGEIRYVDLKYLKPSLSLSELELPKTKWRVEPEISGGGIFHDIAPHQLAFMVHLFGTVEKANGVSANQANLYKADDIVTGAILFRSKVVFNGLWYFNCGEDESEDKITLVGTKGKISFPVFSGQQVHIETNSGSEFLQFDKLMHVQQPMIEAVVKYFMNERTNPSTAEEGLVVMRLLDAFTGNQKN